MLILTKLKDEDLLNKSSKMKRHLESANFMKMPELIAQKSLINNSIVIAHTKKLSTEEEEQLIDLKMIQFMQLYFHLKIWMSFGFQ